MQEKYNGIRKQTKNPYLNLYEIDAIDKNGKRFPYYFASRNDEEHIKHQTHSMRPEGMAIYAVCGGRADRIVLLRQYRYPLNDYIYELPAGLIERHESANEGAVREMKEETGLNLTVYEGGQSYFRRPYFLAQGLTDESGCMVFGTYTGQISGGRQEDSEDIEVILADKKTVRGILETKRVSIRAAFFLTQFLRMNEKDPFLFLRE